MIEEHYDTSLKPTSKQAIADALSEPLLNARTYEQEICSSACSSVRSRNGLATVGRHA